MGLFAGATQNKETQISHVKENKDFDFFNVPEIPQSILSRLQQYNSVRHVNFLEWLPGGQSILINTDLGESMQLYTIKQPGGMREQITFFPDPVYYGTFCPDKKKQELLYTIDVGGNENYQIFNLNLKNGAHALLTDGKSKYGRPLWSHRGDRFVYFSTKRNGKDWDIFIQSRDENEEQLLIKNEGVWVPVCWSHDDSKLIVEHYVSSKKATLYIYNLKRKKLTAIKTTDSCVSFGGVLWAKDDRGLFLTATEQSEFLSLQYYDIEQSKMINVTKDIAWNIVDHALSQDGSCVAFAANSHGFSDLYFLDTKSVAYKKVEGIDQGRIYGLSFSPDSQKLSLVLAPANGPPDIYSIKLSDTTLHRWTTSEAGGLPTTDFVTPTITSYPTFDSVGGKPRNIPLLVYTPKKTKQPPVLIYIHGGPESQFWPQYKSRISYVVNELGVAVMGPNVRGSAGYGKSYMELDNGFNRDKAVRDIGALITWLKRQPEFDSTRIGVLGGSYGGFMSLASMVAYNDQLACGVDIYGISNFVTFLKNTKSYRRDLRRAEYGDERDPEMEKYLVSISPLTHCDKITKPLFVLQGANDPRVPPSESKQMVDKISLQNGHVWYLLAKNEGHGFSRKSTRLYVDGAIALFLKTYLLK